MTVRVTVSTDTEGPVPVYEGKRLFSRSDDGRPVVRAEIDLSGWAGELIRIDIAGKVRPRAVPISSTGYVACSGEVAAAETSWPLEFVGCENDGSKGTRIGTIGCPALVAPGGENPPFAYTTDEPLWHVMRVAEGARLRLSFKPVLKEEIEDPSQAVVPQVPAEQVRSKGRGVSDTPRRPDVFIYLIDAMRADHLGCYGYTRNTSPLIDKFSGEATLYGQAQTAATWTRPSVASLLSGLHSAAHGVIVNHASEVLAQWPKLLSEILQAEGYKTYGMGTNPHIHERFGFDQGWDYYVAKGWEWKAEHGGTFEFVNQEVVRALSELQPDEPVFMYLHTLEPHTPYIPSAESLRRFDRGFEGQYDGSVADMRRARHIRPKVNEQDVGYLIDLYDAEIFDADIGFARFIEIIRSAGRLENSLIILVSDHGEAFAEHNTIIHGRSLNQEELHVPLIIRFPHGRFAGARVKQPVSLVDVFPTVLSTVGITPDLSYPIAGRDVSLLALQSEFSASCAIHAEVSARKDNRLHLLGVIDEDGYKTVIDVSRVPGKVAPEETIGLWNTRTDPREERDIKAALPVRSCYHEQLIAHWLVSQLQWSKAQPLQKRPEVELTDELRRDLDALGYLD